jgi:hypothetical protein
MKPVLDPHNADREAEPLWIREPVRWPDYTREALGLPRFASDLREHDLTQEHTEELVPR